MRAVMLVLVVLLLVSGTGSASAQLTPPRQGARNVRGIHTLAASRQAIDDQLTWASGLAGVGGHVTQPFLGIGAETTGPSADALAYVEGAYARGLNPILVLQGQYVNRDGCNATGYVGWRAPTPDSDGGRYTREAAGYARFVAGLPRRDDRTLTVQLANEPNLSEMWGGVVDPAAYARFQVDVAAAIRALGDPRIRVLNAALAPEGSLDNLEFIAAALTAEPAFAQSFDAWASHPYPRNQPPANNLHDGTALPNSRYAIDAYQLELETLARHGVKSDQLRVVLTETGYELGDRHYGEYPPIGDALRADYMAEAFAHWARWPEVQAVTPFQLSGWYGSWRSFDWVHPSSLTGPHGLPTQPRLQYGRLLLGMGMVTGSVQDDRGRPVGGVDMVAEPGGYLATSLPDGSFVLLARPGEYTLRASRTGFVPETMTRVPVAAGTQTPLAIRLPAEPSPTLRNPGFDDDDLSGWTAWGDVDGTQAGPWFFGIEAAAGARFVGTAVNCGAKDGGLYQTVSTTPGTLVTVEAATLTRRDGAAPIANRVGVDPWGGADPRAATIIWSEPVETHSAWQRITLAVQAESDRVTVFLAFDQDAANPWNVSAFDDIRMQQTP
ncbi:MAG: carboxypeptidase regulatory-like domain-containing protein [Chloroflexi bacterium]|nr:carboxypeptidase regulatory-like domain-containing protein [Chloroflexota bacterium]